jgi:DhnA family fructose-bisphosphate aldolase class Ia
VSWIPEQARESYNRARLVKNRIDNDRRDDYSSGQCIVSLERPVSQYGKHIRLRRILRSARGTLVVAFDHPLVLGPIPGTRRPANQIARFIEGQADALLLNFRFVHEAVPDAPSLPGLIARLDWTTALGTASKNPVPQFRSCLLAHPEDALRAGADAVITFLVIGSDDPDFEKNEIRRVGVVARECEKLGVPLIVESLARGKALRDAQDPEWLLLHSRIASELGADIIKTEFTSDPATMRQVVEACPIPILVLGGSRTGSDEDIIAVTRDIVSSGAAGVFFGRNVFQAKDIPDLMHRLHAILSGESAKSRR